MKENRKKLILIIVFVIFGIISLNTFIENNKKNQKEQVVPTYSEFLRDVKNEKVKEIVIIEKAKGTRELNYVMMNNEKHKILAPADETLMKFLNESKVTVKADKEDEGNFLLNVFISWFPMILLICVWVYFMRKSMGGGKGGIFGLSKNKSKLIAPNDIDVTFKDIVGCEEVKEEVKEVVEFLKNREKFAKLGGKIPSGILLTGSAGVGKTLLGKAIAKEAGVPFFAMSGSDFVEMFVGLGAARVRDLFAEAKKVTPCIIFIDEIDAIGGKRGSGMGNAQEEREQTLDQILVEMDGISSVDGIIIIGATNRADGLDPALLRPGRLDRKIFVPLPDVKGREEILKVHINKKNVPISMTMDIGKIAKGTSGFSGAELSNLVNEAAIMAARKSKMFVEQEDFEMARDKIIMGPERKNAVMPEKEKINTAYHESGHVLVAKLMNAADPVYKVTIIPRGNALGLMLQVQLEDKYTIDKEYLLTRISIALGGRIAEEVFFNHITTGATSDIASATNIAEKMVKEWGMSDLGMITFGNQVGGAWGGQHTMSNLSQETIREVDLEIRKIISKQYDITKELIVKNKDMLEKIAKALLESETLEDWQIDNILNGKDFNFKE